MNKKRIAISTVIVVVFVLIIGGTINIGSWGADGSTPLVSPEAIGARFSKSDMTAISINPTVTREQAQQAALQKLLQNWGLPSGRGIEENITVQSTTVSFSGTRYGHGPRTVTDRNAWVVVFKDPPISLPCGGAPLSGQDTTPESNCSSDNSPQYHVAIDAESGKVISSELSGAGPMPQKWHAIAAANPPPANQPTRPPKPTPTAAPTPNS